MSTEKPDIEAMQQKIREIGSGIDEMRSSREESYNQLREERQREAVEAWRRMERGEDCELPFVPSAMDEGE